MESMTDQSGIRSGDGDAFDTGDWKPADGGQWRPAPPPLAEQPAPIECDDPPCPICGGGHDIGPCPNAARPGPIDLAFELGRATGMIRDALTYGWAGCAREDAQAWLERIDAWAMGSGETL